MRQTKFLFMAVLVLIMSNSIISCKKDPAPQETKTVENPELAAKLKALGFQVEGGVITIDDKVMNTTSLDLSGAKISNLAGLELFPKLEEVNLSNNNFGDTFDFTQLPKTVTSVNLADNNIYIYNGLATVSENGFNLQRKLTKLVLPATARFNVDLLPHYYNETKGSTTFKMQNPETKAVEDYTTLRMIPDETLREGFKRDFPSVMTDDGKMDIGKSLSANEGVIDFSTDYYYGTENWEGIEYLLNRPEYNPSALDFILGESYNDKPYKYNYPYSKIKSNLGVPTYVNVDVNIDFSEATNVYDLLIVNNPSLEVIDFSHSTKFMKQDVLFTASQDGRNEFLVYKCPKLREIKLADDVRTTSIFAIELIDLPNLTTFTNIDKIIGLREFTLINLPKIEFDMPNIQQYANQHGQLNPDEFFYFAVSEDMISNPKVKAFIIKYGKLGKLKETDDTFLGTQGEESYFGNLKLDFFTLYDFTQLY